jgi:hypothetical protein
MERTADALEALGQRQLAGKESRRVAQRPAALDPRGDDPEKRLAVAHALRGVRLPLAHVPGVGNDARSRLHREDLRSQLLVEVGQQVERQHGRAREVFLEDVAFDDRHLAADTRSLRVAPRQRGEVAVVFDADGFRAELLRRRNRQPAVARTQVVDDIGARRPLPSPASARPWARASAAT